MDLAGKARKLERKITRAVDAAVTELVGQSGTAPIEIVHRVLDAAEAEIQEIGRGRRVFPFNRVRVHVLADAGDRQAQARVAAVIEGPPSLRERMIERLRAARCEPPAIDVEVAFTPARGEQWQHADFHVEFDRAADPFRASPVGTSAKTAPRIKLTILNGSAEQRVYVFNCGRIDIGRQRDVFDQRQRLIRTNHVAFVEEGPEPNPSVSRRHAHVELSEQDRSYRVWDDGSAHGTSIIRQGRTIRVPPGVRGAKLESGDELVLGQARLRVTLEPTSRA